MSIDLIIATNKKQSEIEDQIAEIKRHTEYYIRIIPTCQDGSAAHNRNYGIEKSKAGFIIMIDDDIKGFYTGWTTDLLRPLLNDKSIGVISARLIDEKGKPAIMDVWGRSETMSPGVFFKKWIPSACIAMRREDLNAITESPEFPFNKPFDENYKKASFEDSDLLEVYRQLLKKQIAVNNHCKVIHHNRESWRPGFRWEDNREYFQKKWGFTP